MEGRTATADRYAAFKFYGRGTLLEERGRRRRGDDGGLFKMLLLHRVMMISNKREIALQNAEYELLEENVHTRHIDFKLRPRASSGRQVCPV